MAESPVLGQVEQGNEALAAPVLLRERRLVDVLLDVRQRPAPRLAVGLYPVFLRGRADDLIRAEVLGGVERDADVRGGEFQRSFLPAGRSTRWV